MITPAMLAQRAAIPTTTNHDPRNGASPPQASHRHWDATGRVYLPYLAEWNPSTSNLVDLIGIMASLFSANPPLRAGPRPAQQQGGPALFGAAGAAGAGYQQQQPAYPPYAGAAAQQQQLRPVFGGALGPASTAAGAAAAAAAGRGGYSGIGGSLPMAAYGPNGTAGGLMYPGSATSATQQQYPPQQAGGYGGYQQQQATIAQQRQPQTQQQGYPPQQQQQPSQFQGQGPLLPATPITNASPVPNAGRSPFSGGASSGAGAGAAAAGAGSGSGSGSQTYTYAAGAANGAGSTAGGGSAGGASGVLGPAGLQLNRMSSDQEVSDAIAIAVTERLRSQLNSLFLKIRDDIDSCGAAQEKLAARQSSAKSVLAMLQSRSEQLDKYQADVESKLQGATAFLQRWDPDLRKLGAGAGADSTAGTGHDNASHSSNSSTIDNSNSNNAMNGGLDRDGVDGERDDTASISSSQSGQQQQRQQAQQKRGGAGSTTGASSSGGHQYTARNLALRLQSGIVSGGGGGGGGGVSGAGAGWLPSGQSVDEVVIPSSRLQAQLLDSVAEDAAIEDLYYLVDSAAERRRIEPDVMVKEIRELARRQFRSRHLARKIDAALEGNARAFAGLHAQYSNPNLVRSASVTAGAAAGTGGNGAIAGHGGGSSMHLSSHGQLPPVSPVTSSASSSAAVASTAAGPGHQYPSFR